MNTRRVVFVVALALTLGGGVLYKSPVSFAAGSTAPAYNETRSNFFYTQAASVYTAVQDLWNGLFGAPVPATPTAHFEVQPPKPIVTPTAQIPVPTEATRPPSVSTTTITRVTQPVIERTIERTRALSGITTTDLESQISALRSELLTEIAKGKTQAQQDNNSLYLAMAPMNRINNLSSVTISNPTITSATVSSGSLSGTFSGSVSGTSGSFTTLGIGTSTPSDTFAVNGVTYLADVTAPSVTINRLYSNSGNLYWAGSIIGGSVGSWTLSGSDVYRASGNVGIGTTSPFTALSVTGNGYLSGALNVGATSTTRSNLGLAYASNTDVINNMNIAAWGDSITFGGQGSVGVGLSYRSILALLINKSIYNGGVSGETSTQIKTRMLADPAKYSWPTIIWAGRNNYTIPTTVKADIASMVAALQSVGNSNYIILSVLNGSTEPSGTADYNTIIQLNTDLAAIYGSHYLDMRAYLVQNGLSVAGITPTAQDTTDIANDVPPTSLRADSIHPNSDGYKVVANYLFQNISLLQTYPTALVTTQNLQNILSHSVNVSGFVNTDQYSGFQQNGLTILSASTTNYSLLVGTSAGAALLSGGLYNTALGYQSLTYATSSSYNTAVGYRALFSNTIGFQNTANGYSSLSGNTTGYGNTANGVQALLVNTTGYYNTANGMNALYANTTGYYNTANGFGALRFNTTGYANIANGINALYSNTTGYGNIANGYQSLNNNTTGVWNTSLGYNSGYGVTTGSRNVLIGQSTVASSYNQVTTGSNNIAIGNDVAVASPTASNQLNIGNLIYGTGLNGTGATVSTGNIGIGTTTPYAKLSVHANNGDTNTTLFTIASSTASATTTLFTVLNTGNVGIGTAAPLKALQVIGDIRVGTSGTNGCLENFAGTALTGVCSSDVTLKTNIQPLGSVLTGLVQLTPSTFYWNDVAGNELHNSTTTLNYGLIAQDVARVLPGMVATTTNGYLGVNYSMLPILTLQGLKDLDLNVESLASTTAATVDVTGGKTFAGRFFDRITGWLADAANGIGEVVARVFRGKEFHAEEKICIGHPGDETCVTKDQLDALLVGKDAASVAASVSATTTASSTPITISINGNNPATIKVGDTYGDLGALIAAPESAKNFNIKASIDGGPELDISQITIDTSVAGSHKIVYSVVDQNNATTTAERTVNVVAPAPVEAATTTQSSVATSNDTGATEATQ